MLFFRSEEQVRVWCRANGYEQGPLVTMYQLWGMATAFYSTRLQEDSRRPKPEEVRGMFAAIGLEGDFWDPLAISRN